MAARTCIHSRRFKRLKQRVVKVDQSRNGVKVTVWRFYDKHGCSGTSVEAECQCFGHECRVHSNPSCPVLARAS